MRVFTMVLEELTNIFTAIFVVAGVALGGWFLWTAEFIVQMTVLFGAIVLVPCFLLSMNDLRNL